MNITYVKYEKGYHLITYHSKVMSNSIVFFCGQTDKQTGKNYMPKNYRCGGGIKNEKGYICLQKMVLNLKTDLYDSLISGFLWMLAVYKKNLHI